MAKKIIASLLLFTLVSSQIENAAGYEPMILDTPLSTAESTAQTPSGDSDALNAVSPSINSSFMTTGDFLENTLTLTAAGEPNGSVANDLPGEPIVPVIGTSFLFEAENMEASGGTWNGGSYVSIWGNGELHQTVNPGGLGVYEIEVIAQGVSGGQAKLPEMKVLVDGVMTGDPVEVTNNNWNYKIFTIRNVELGAGSHDIGLGVYEFLAGQSIGIERIILRKTGEIAFEPAKVAIAAVNMQASGGTWNGGDYMTLWGNGELHQSQTIQESGVYEVEVVAVGGDGGFNPAPSLKVMSDGVMIGSEVAITDSHWNYKGYKTAKIELTAGVHDLSLGVYSKLEGQFLGVKGIILRKVAEISYALAKISIDAMSMQASGGTWNGGNYFALWGNGELHQMLNITVSGVYEIEVVGFGSDGGLSPVPSLRVMADGVMTGEPVAITNSNWNYKGYKAGEVELSAGAHDLALGVYSKLNGQFLGVKGIILRKVADIAYEPAKTAIAAVAMQASGGVWNGGDYVTLWGNGELHQIQNIQQAGIYEIEVIAVGSDAGLSPAPSLRVMSDGVMIGDEVAVSNTNWNYKGYKAGKIKLSAGSHDLSIGVYSKLEGQFLGVEGIILRKVADIPYESTKTSIDTVNMQASGGVWNGGNYVALWGNGELHQIQNIAVPGVYEIEIIGFGSDGGLSPVPSLRVMVDGLMNGDTVAITNSNWNYKKYKGGKIELSAGVHDLSLGVYSKLEGQFLGVKEIILRKVAEIPYPLVKAAVDAVNMQPSGGTWNGGNYMTLWGNGELHQNQNIQEAGVYEIEVVAVGGDGGLSPAPSLKMMSDGVMIGNEAAIPNNNWNYRGYMAGKIELSAGTHDLSLGVYSKLESQFLGVKGIILRKVGEIPFPSATLTGNAGNLQSSGSTWNGGSYITMWGNGKLQLSQTIQGSGIYEIQVDAVGAPNGQTPDPALNILVDGVVYGDPLPITNNLWNYKSFKASGIQIHEGEHSLSINIAASLPGQWIGIKKIIIRKIAGTRDTVPPVIQLVSPGFSNQADYLLVYTVDGIRKEERVLIEEGKNFLVRKAEDAAGNKATRTFEITLDSKPPVVEIFKINQGAAVTKRNEVTLSITGYDLGSQMSQMAFSNDGVNFSDPEAYATAKQWTLEGGKGTKTVWVKLRDTQGFWSDPVSAGIFYEKAFVMDNFDGESQVQTYWDIDAEQVYQRSIVSEGAFEGASAMKVDFNKDAAHFYSYFALAPKQDGTANDFSAFRTLRLQLKKLHATPMVLLAKIEFNGTNETYETQVSVPQGVSNWTEAIFDFSSVSADRLKNIRDILFFVDPGVPTQGSFLIDNIVLDEQVPSKLLDDFEGNSAPIGTYWDLDPGVYQRDILEEAAFDGTHAMKVQYAKKTGMPYSTFAFQPAQNGVSNNFSNYGSLRFYLNKISPDPFVILMKLEFNGTDQTFEKELHFPQGSNAWKEVVFDFSEAPASLLSNVKNVLFFVDPASETASGAFYLDRLRLAEAPALRLLDDFEGNSGLIDSYWDIDGSGVVYTRTIDNTQGADGTHSMRVDYHKSVQYPTSLFGLAPKQDGQANDFSRFNALKLLVKKESLPAMKLMIKFDLEDTQINFESWKEIPQGASDWTELEFDLSSLNPETLKKVRAILFFVDPVFFSAPQATNGVFYLDSIRLAYDPDLPAKQFDPARPPQIGWVGSSVASDLDNEYRSGSLVRINAWELNATGDLLDGTVRIVSRSTGYDSGEQKLIFLHDGQFWPYHWDTTGLPPADDYGVIVTMRDKSGNETRSGTVEQPALTISLTKGLPPVGQLLQVTDFSLPLTGGTKMAFSRSYDPSDGGVFDRQLGLDWHSGVDYFIQDFPDGTASLNLGDQGYSFFFRNPDGSYRPMQSNNYSRLTKLNRGFELELKDGTAYRFDSAPFVDLNTKTTVTWFLTTARDPNQNETRFFYDSNRNLEKILLPSGDEIQLAYSFREKDQFNTRKFNLDKITGPTGLEWKYEHDVKGNLLSVTGPEGGKTRYEYGPKSRLTKIIYPDLSTEEYEYDSEGRMLKNSRNGALQQEFIYGAKNDPVLQIKDALGRVAKQEYSLGGQLVESTDVLGNKTRFEYDARRNLIKQTDAKGSVIRFSYDDRGNLLEAIDALGHSTRYTYEAVFNQMTSMTDAKEKVSRYVYDSRGNLVRLIDADGNITEFIYDSRGNVLESKDALGGTTRFTYNVRSLQTSQTNPLNQTFIREYDARGNLSRMIDLLGGVTLFEYDMLGRLLRQTDPNGHTTANQYDVMGRIILQTDAAGKSVSLEYNNKGQLIRKTDRTGAVTQFAYDAKGNLVSQTDALGNVMRLTYDALDRVTQQTDALGHITSFSYDLLGQLISKTDALGNTTQFEYDALGRVVKTTLPNQSVTKTVYDELGRVVSTTDALNNTSEYTYDSRGNKLTEKDAKGAVTTRAYDAANQVVSQTDALGNATRFSYDSNGKLTETRLPDGAVTTSIYDFLGRVIETRDPLGRSQHFEYDAVGNLLRQIDAAAKITNFEYDSLNRVVAEKDSLGNITRYTHDADGRVTSILDAKGNLSGMRYDLMGRLIEQTYADGSTMANTYDANGNVITMKDRLGRITQMNYDELNRLTGKRFSDGTRENFTYDKLGNILTATNEEGTIRNDYDLFGRLTRQTDVFGNILDYAYDQTGNQKSMNAAAGNHSLSRDYTYDVLDRLTKIRDEKSRETLYAYDVNSRIISKRLPNQARMEYSYNLASEMAAIVHKDSAGVIFRRIDYTHDNRGLITGQNDSFAGAQTFQYDDLQRLQNFTNPETGTAAFEFDALGNRTQIDSQAGDENYTVNNLNQYLTKNTDIFEYDLTGNLIKQHDTVTGLERYYEYNAQNRLAKVVLEDGTEVRFRYDALGRRISKSGASGSFRYIWDGNEILAEMDGLGNLLKNYVHGLEIDELLYQENYAADETFYFHTDHLMSTLALTDGAGRLKESFNYDPYGNLIKAKDQNGNSLAAFSTDYLYTGRQLDSETGIYYNRNRYYDPSLGRFISADPKGEAGGLNLYAYTKNNPLSFRDPLGLDSYWGGCGGFAGGFFGAVGGFMSSAAHSVGSAISSAAGAVASAASSAASAAYNAVSSAISSIGSAMSQAFSGGGSNGGGNGGPSGDLPGGAGIEIAPGTNQPKGSSGGDGSGDFYQGLNISGPGPLGPEGASRGDACGSCRTGASSGGMQPLLSISRLNEIFPKSIDIQYQTFQGIDAGLEGVGAVALGVKITGPINGKSVIGGTLAGLSGVSGANPTKALIDPVAGLSIPGMKVNIGRTGVSGGNNFAIGPFSFSPVNVNSRGEVSSSLNLKAGIGSKGFNISFGSAGVSISRRKR